MRGRMRSDGRQHFGTVRVGRLRENPVCVAQTDRISTDRPSLQRPVRESTTARQRIYNCPLASLQSPARDDDRRRRRHFRVRFADGTRTAASRRPMR